MSAGTSSEAAMLFGASDLASAPSLVGRAALDRERRHWRARSVPSMTFPSRSSIRPAASPRRQPLLSTAVNYFQMIYYEANPERTRWLTTPPRHQKRTRG